MSKILKTDGSFNQGERKSFHLDTSLPLETAIRDYGFYDHIALKDHFLIKLRFRSPSVITFHFWSFLPLF
jgi:hypothetical protein